MGAENDPLFTVLKLAEKYALHLEDALSQHGLSSIGWCLLLRLNERDGDNTTTLASRTTYERSSVVRALEKMEHKKFVRRSTHHRDRRNSIVFITSAGRAKFKRAAESVLRMREQAYAGLSASPLNAVASLLRSIDSNLTERARNGTTVDASSVR
jgi:DNA-binding MarR family transcriptional regulator